MHIIHGYLVIVLRSQLVCITHLIKLSTCSRYQAEPPLRVIVLHLHTLHGQRISMCQAITSSGPWRCSHTRRMWRISEARERVAHDRTTSSLGNTYWAMLGTIPRPLSEYPAVIHEHVSGAIPPCRRKQIQNSGWHRDERSLSHGDACSCGAQSTGCNGRRR